MKILVTGGAGYIGSHTVVELVNAGYEPVIVDNFCNSSRSVLDGLKEILGKPVACHEGDCCDLDFMRRVFDEEKEIAGAIHFAALKAVGESVEKPELYHKNNIGSLETLMSVMEEFKASLLVFSSSCTVYGNPDKLPVTEQSPIKEAESPYGETKQLCEQMIEQAVGNGRFFRAASLRYFNPIGAHPSAKIGELPLGVPNNLVPFVTQTAAGILPELTIFGDDYDTPDGTPVRDYVHVVDLARAHVCSLNFLEKKIENRKEKIESQKQNNEDKSDFEADFSILHSLFSPFYTVFNLGTGHGNSVLEVIKTFEEVTGISLPYKIGPRRAGDVVAVYANADKAEKELGWKSELTLADALKDAWKWQCALEENG